MRTTFVTAFAVAALAVSGAQARGQTCLGYPAFATGPFNVSGAVGIGTEWWGLGVDVHVGNRTGGFFGGGGIATINYVEDPVESRISPGAVFGYNMETRGQLHVCPFVSGAYERGNEVERSVDERSRISGYIAGIGVALAGELPNRRFQSFSVAPFAAARFTERSTKEEFDTGATDEDKETGVTISAGLGLRFRDAIQITPSFSTSTFDNADLVFNLRFSVALQRRAP
jgi:hypothetical protein